MNLSLFKSKNNYTNKPVDIFSEIEKKKKGASSSEILYYSIKALTFRNTIVVVYFSSQLNHLEKFIQK